jgi:ABC-type sugar transport system ATPase subunit
VHWYDLPACCYLPTILDAPLRMKLREEMLALQQEFGTATILVTHDPEEAALLADGITVLEGGPVLQSGWPVPQRDAAIQQ